MLGYYKRPDLTEEFPRNGEPGVAVGGTDPINTNDIIFGVNCNALGIYFFTNFQS